MEVSEGNVRPPKLYFILTNIAKQKNAKDLIGIAASFGASEVLVVGLPKLNVEELRHLYQEREVGVRRFESLESCVVYLKDKGATIVGVEILANAQSVRRSSFDGDTAIMLGNEGSGMSSKQVSLCDRFIYVEHYGSGTGSLNVAVAGAIIMHRFATWAKFFQ